MSGGGGGQSGETRYDWNPVTGSYWGGQPGPNGTGGGGILGWGFDEASKPYQQYGGERIAGQNTDIWTGQQRIRDMANSGGPSDTVAGRTSAGNIASGSQVDANPYGGMTNPYFQNVLRSGMEDITNAYKQGTAADTTRMMNLSGVFGGSAHQNAVANNENALGKQLSQYAQGMQNQQYDRSAGLYESGLGRQMQAIPLAFQGQGLSTDLINQTQGVGNTNRAYQQQFMDQNYNDWTNAQNWGRQNVDWLGNLLGRAQGSTGITTSQAGYQPTNWGSTAVGAGLLGNAAGLF